MNVGTLGLLVEMIPKAGKLRDKGFEVIAGKGWKTLGKHKESLMMKKYCQILIKIEMRLDDINLVSPAS